MVEAKKERELMKREREKKWTKKEEIVKIKSTIIAMICEL